LFSDAEFNMRATTAAVLSVMLTACCTIAAAADDPFFSGPQPGEKLAALKMQVLLGQGAGKEADPVTAAGGKPVVIVFVHQITRPSIGTMRMVMNYANSRRKEGLCAAVVLLTADVTETTNFVKRASHAMPKNIQLGVSAAGIEGPGAYGLNRKATITAVVGKQGKVTANFALIDPSQQADAPKIATAIAAALGDKKPVTLAQLGVRRPAANGRMQDPQLETQLRTVIQKNATAEQVNTAAAKLEAYCDKNPAAARRVGEITRQIIAAGRLEKYGTPAAQKHLKHWAKKYAASK